MERILIYQTAFFGDLLLAIPFIKAIRARNPNAEIHLACRQPLAALFLQAGLVDQAHELKKNDSEGRVRFESELIAINWNFVFCLHRSTRSHLLMFRLRAEKIYGFYKWWSFWKFTNTVVYDTGLPDALRQLSVLSLLDDEIKNQISSFNVQERRKVLRSQEDHADGLEIPEWASLKLPTVALENAIWVEWRKDSRPWIFISPGSQWNTKRWTRDGFRAFTKDQLSRGRRVLAVGSADESKLIDSLGIQDAYFHNLAGRTTLLELLALFQRGQLLVSNDSGSMHLAACATLPTVAIFGPTVLELGYEPWQDQARVVEIDLACRPCGKHGHDQCPIGTHACMKEVDSSQVTLRAEKLIQP